jgi:diaminohydroxyphosphoribosylaminopyrimidine deaminase/5-amino-6-(5-phosphoribosylamino)uracil reductase
MAADAHEKWMRLAIELALKGKGQTSPNPLVGTVIVRDGVTLSQGYHKKAGGDHAEIEALKQINFKAEGADMYVNLEPCDHYGRTKPCTDSIIASGIKRVFVGSIDPNPLVRGKGIQKLRDNHIDVRVGILQDECIRLNESFIKFMQSRLPFVTAKLAVTLDGRIAAPNRDAAWISNQTAREWMHTVREVNDAILVGVNTVIQDNPHLTVRLHPRRCPDPKRIIVDSHLRTPTGIRMFTEPEGGPVIIATIESTDHPKAKTLIDCGARILTLPEKDGHVDLKAMLKALGDRDIINILVDGGGTIITELISQKLIDKLIFIVAPKIIGNKGITSIADLGIRRMEDVISLKDTQIKCIGDNAIFEGYLQVAHLAEAFDTIG